MGKAIIDISTHMLRELLFLPPDTEVLYTMLSEYPETIRLVVESPDIPETVPGEMIPKITPGFRREQVPSTVTLVDWGLR